jgi:hypothetical protein
MSTQFQTVKTREYWRRIRIDGIRLHILPTMVGGVHRQSESTLNLQRDLQRTSRTSKQIYVIPRSARSLSISAKARFCVVCRI